MNDVNIQQDETMQVEEVIVTKETEQSVPETTEEKPEETVETTEKVEEPKPTPDQKFEKKKKTFQERIDQKTAEVYKLRKELEEERKKNKVSDSDKPKVPNIQKFINDEGMVDEEKYNEAMAEYNEKFFEYRESKKKQEEIVQVTKSEEDLKQKSWEDVATRAIQKYPDLQEVTSKDVYNPVLIDVLRDKAKVDIEEETTVSADLAYYLGKNPAELARINRLVNDPVNMIIELGKIQGKIESLTKNISKAVPPIEPLDSEKGAMPTGELTDEEILDQYYKKQLEKQKQKYG